MANTKKNKFEVGDVVYFKYCESRNGEHQGVCKITAIRNSGSFRYRIDLLHGDKGWLAAESELRHLTKLERALR